MESLWLRSCFLASHYSYLKNDTDGFAALNLEFGVYISVICIFCSLHLSLKNKHALESGQNIKWDNYSLLLGILS